MNVLFIGDPHLKITKFTLVKSFLKWLDSYIEQNKDNIDLVVNLGDTFHTHAVVRSEVQGEFKKHLENTLRYCPYIYVLGNHDMYKPDDSRYHALETYKGLHPNLTIIDKITDIGNITYVPYQFNMDDFPKKTKSICVAHQQFIGCDYGYHRPEVGVNADNIECDLIISGHIHKRQVFGKVVYPGTPFAQDVKDIDEDKGIMLFNTETLKYSFVSTPLPQWKSIDINLLDNSVDHEHERLIKTIGGDDNWVINAVSLKPELSAYLESERFLTFKDGKSIKIRPKYVEKEKKKTVIKSVTLSGIIEEYIDSVYEGTISKDILKKRVKGIIG